MSAVRKLVIAAALVATGLGVAFLLGEAAVVQQKLNSALHAVQATTSASKPVVTSTPASSTTAHVQLLPEPAATSVPQTTIAPPALISSLVPVAASTTEVSPTGAKPSPNDAACPIPRLLVDGRPAAKLRNEAPRPIGNEPRSPVAIRRMPPVDDANTQLAQNQSNRVNTVGADWSGSPTLPAAGSATPDSPLATTAAYSAPAAAPNTGLLAPPPWPAPVQRHEPRTHIIADGDSLERLAGRYLDDPQRGREIFELNRDVLGSPELLPIGAELKIPERVASNSWNRQGRLVEPTESNPLHAASRGNLVPIRTMSAADPYDVAPPRAQLAHPIAIE